ncbi:MAG TPA: hypothetical protein VMU98_03315 [Acidimicrobiales bacterium]|nr:hypothetical protein [Acidimicrobiales bacterium]
MSAPLNTTLLVPTRHCDRRDLGSSGKRHLKLPGTSFTGLTAKYLLSVVDVVGSDVVVDVLVVEVLVAVPNVVVVDVVVVDVVVG